MEALPAHAAGEGGGGANSQRDNAFEKSSGEAYSKDICVAECIGGARNTKILNIGWWSLHTGVENKGFFDGWRHNYPLRLI